VNAPASNPHPPAWRSYGPALDRLMPCKDGEERRLRCGMMLMRDRAMRAREKAGWESGLILRAVQDIASEHALSPMSVEQLKHLHYSLVRLVATASNLETISQGGVPNADG
jgi:hypothetical protein